MNGPIVMRVYVGTYTTGASHGIYVLEFDPAAGRWLSGPALAARSDNPSFLARHPKAPLLYAVNELQAFEGTRSGAVSAYAIDQATGRLALVNQQASAGTDPCHLVVDATGRYVFVANYTCGNVAVLPLGDDGRLQPVTSIHRCDGCGPVVARQEGPHAHGVLLDATGRYVLFTDLGADRVYVDRFDPGTGRLETHDASSLSTAPGSGPRHLAWHPSGRALYLLNELDATVNVLRFDARREVLELVQTVETRPGAPTDGNTAAEIVVAPDGRFVYTSNRGDDAIVVLQVAPDALTLARRTQVSSEGRRPRSFAIDRTGRWLIAANQDSSTLVVFRLDAVTGRPRTHGQAVTVPDPTCVLVEPAV